VNSLLDSNNGRITIAGVRDGQVSVTGGPSALPGQSQAPTDQDNDGVYEDVNGDGTADLRDLQPFFNLVRPSASSPNNPSFFDVNGDGSADLRDLQPFFNEVRP
jgi:PKD repeat protein